MKNADRRSRGRQSPVTSRKNFSEAGNNKNERAIYPRSLPTSLESLHSLPPPLRPSAGDSDDGLIVQRVANSPNPREAAVAKRFGGRVPVNQKTIKIESEVKIKGIKLAESASGGGENLYLYLYQ